MAHAINLQSSDVPAMGTLVAGFEAKNGPPFPGCTTGAKARDMVRAADSPWLLRATGERRFGAQVFGGRPPVEAVHSVVYVMNEPKVAANSIAAAGNPDVAGCVQQAASKESSGRLVGHELYKRGIRAAALGFPVTGVPYAPPGYGIRVTGTLAGAVYHETSRQPFYEDTFGFAVGPIEVVLHAGGVGRPFPADEERHLLSLLYDRARAQAAR